MDINVNLGEIRKRATAAAVAAGRDSRDIRLLAVSKTMSADIVAEAFAAGQRIFAENKVQEWLDKVDKLPPECEWHLIGRLQTNKVKYLDRRIALIHSLDRFDLLRVLEEQGAKKDIMWDVLVQVNIAGDQAKAGMPPGETADFLTAVKDHPHVRVHGLMTIGALEASLEETRTFFRDLRLLRDKLRGQNWPSSIQLRELSMGMSQDFEVAIAEGATMVRVGRQIFGERVTF